MKPLKKGTPVSIKGTTLEGTVEQAAIPDGENVQYLVKFKDEEGVVHEAWQHADRVVEVKSKAKGG